MSHTRAVTAIVLGVLLSASAVARAQTPPPPPPPPRAPQAPPAPPVPPVPPTLPQRLPNVEDSRRIDLVLSRWVGDKRIESLPFSQLSAAPFGGASAYNSMRLGVDLPTTRTTTTTANGVVRTEPVTAYLGTNIDTYLRQTAAGIYELDIRLTHTMLAQPPKDPGPATPRPLTDPATRTISLQSKLTLHEGRTQLVNSGTDVITGETARLEVTVTTVK